MQAAEELACGGAGGGGEVLEGAVFFGGDELGEFADVGGFAAFSAVGHRGEEGAIGFQHELAEGSDGEGVADVPGVFEGGDAGEADQRTELEDLGGFRGGSGEAMEHAPEAAAVGGHEVEGFAEGGALVDDAVQTPFGGHVELLAEELPLFVHQPFDFGFGHAVETVAVQAGFADGDGLGVAGEFVEGGGDVVGFFGDVVGVDTDDGEDGVEAFGEGEGAAAAGEGGADGEDTGDSGFLGALDDGLQVWLELGEVEVRVGVVEFGHAHGGRVGGRGR